MTVPALSRESDRAGERQLTQRVRTDERPAQVTAVDQAVMPGRRTTRRTTVRRAARITVGMLDRLFDEIGSRLIYMPSASCPQISANKAENRRVSSTLSGTKGVCR